MDNRRSAAISFAAAIGVWILTPVIAHYLSSPPDWAYFVGLFLGLGFLVNAVLMYFISSWNLFSFPKKNEAAPLEIIFDRRNGDMRFWNLEVKQENEKPVRFWEYRVEIKNNSKKTVRNVTVRTQWVERTAGLPSVHHRNATFKRLNAETCDLQPGCSEMVPVLTWPDPVVLPGLAWGASIYPVYGALKVIASGDDIDPTERRFKFNYALQPMIFDWVTEPSS